MSTIKSHLTFHLAYHAGSLSEDLDGVITCYQWTITSSDPDSNEVVQGTGATSFARSYPEEQRLSIILRVSDDPAASADCAPIPPGSDLADPNLFNGSDTESYEIVCDFTPPVAEAGPTQNVTLSGGSVDVLVDGSQSRDD